MGTSSIRQVPAFDEGKKGQRMRKNQHIGQTTAAQNMRNQKHNRELERIRRALLPQAQVDEQIFITSLTNKVRSHFMRRSRDHRTVLMEQMMAERKKRGQHPLTGK